MPCTSIAGGRLFAQENGKTFKEVVLIREDLSQEEYTLITLRVNTLLKSEEQASLNNFIHAIFFRPAVLVGCKEIMKDS